VAKDGRSGKAQRHRKQRERRQAAQEQLHEDHMRLVNDREGDPRFVQRRRLPNGSMQLSLPDEAVQREFVAKMRENFREHFGHYPGPDDPLFFDPDASYPKPLDDRALDMMVEELAQQAQDAGVDPAYLRAFHDVGYLVTADTQHTFTAHEVQAYLEAVERHQAAAAQQATDGLHQGIEEALRTAVSAIVSTCTDRAAVTILEYLDRLGDEQHGETAEGKGYALAFGTLAAWLVGTVERGLSAQDAEDAVAWVTRQLGEMNGRSTLEVAGMIQHPAARQATLDEIVGDLGDQGVLIALVWLTAGVVATAGHGQTSWLPAVADRSS
jgi:hypothetical protein